MEDTVCWGVGYLGQGNEDLLNLLEPPVPALLLHCGRDNPAALQEMDGLVLCG